MKLTDRIRACAKCPELAATRKNVVIGEGPIPCDMVFLGEAPGKTEDETGRPFVGQSGKLQESCAEAIGLRRGVDYHILNILKCRPPENRDPFPEEIQNCRVYLDHQLRAIKPRIIVAFGRFAQAFILGVPPSTLRVSDHVGEIHDFGDRKAVLTYHPAYVNRNTHPEVRIAFIRHLKAARDLRNKGRKNEMP